jgi:hypothetical protein
MAFPSRASLRQQAADRGRWLSAITLKATNELYQRCAEHAAHLISAYDILRHCGVELGKRDFIGAI